MDEKHYEARFYEKLGRKGVRCNLCSRRCSIPDGAVGACGVRKNIGGKLYSLVYGKIAAIAIDPIEKKPLFHFHPNSEVLSFGTVGCNFFCKYCQNWDLSQNREVQGKNISPEEMVGLALEYNVSGITYTYNEPTIFMEYAQDVAKISRSKKFFNTFVSNGYMTEEAAKEASKFLDAVTIDVKGNASQKFVQEYIGIPSEDPIFTNLEIFYKAGLHIEITDLIIPKVGDDLKEAKKFLERILNELSPSIPIHFLRFYPAYKMLDFPPTPAETLEKLYKLAKDIGFEYVYVGNLPNPHEDTYCPKCGELLIKREGFDVIFNKIVDGKCPKCGAKIYGWFDGKHKH